MPTRGRRGSGGWSSSVRGSRRFAADATPIPRRRRADSREHVGDGYLSHLPLQGIFEFVKAPPEHGPDATPDRAARVRPHARGAEELDLAFDRPVHVRERDPRRRPRERRAAPRPFVRAHEPRPRELAQDAANDGRVRVDAPGDERGIQRAAVMRQEALGVKSDGESAAACHDRDDRSLVYPASRTNGTR
jgi:hypothetical protein